jgi:hypothetical protein
MSTSTVTPIAPVNVQFPHPTDLTQVGPVVQFPDEQTAIAHSPDVWSQLKNETSALYYQAGQAAFLSAMPHGVVTVERRCSL